MFSVVLTGELVEDAEKIDLHGRAYIEFVMLTELSKRARQRVRVTWYASDRAMSVLPILTEGRDVEVRGAFGGVEVGAVLVRADVVSDL